MEIKKTHTIKSQATKTAWVMLILIGFSLFLCVNIVSALNWNDGYLKAYYGFEETTGDVIDEIGNYDGINNGATRGVPGKLGNSFWFKSSESDYVSIPYLFPQAETDLTVSAWVNITGTPPHAYYIIDLRGGIDSVFRIADTKKAGVTEVFSNSIVPIDGSVWTFVAVTYNATNNEWKIYMNGSLENTAISTMITTDPATYGNVNGIGSGSTDHAGTVNYNGEIDELGIWNRTLTADEISELYNGGSGIAPFRKEINLISPVDNALLSTAGANFTANYTVLNIYNLTNATYYLWNSTGIFNNSVVVNITGTSNSTTEYINDFVLGNYEWNVWACYKNATFSNCSFADANYSFFVGATVDAVNYNKNTYETSSETISANITLLEGVELHAVYLYYNGTKYIGNFESLGSNKYYMEKSLDIPLTATILNKSFFWSFVYTSPIQKTQNTTTYNQTVSPIYFGICNATYPTTALNLTTKEEGTFDLLNTSLEFSPNYYLGNGVYYKTLEFSNSTGNNTNYQFCISPADKNFTIEDIISYYAAGYDRREYFLDKAILNNNTMNLNLYLATTASTDIFTITVRDENDDVVPSAFVRVQRWDIGTNNFYTVGMIKTAADGTGILNMRLNDAWYRYQVIYNNILYLTTEPVKESSTARTLNINLAAANPYDQFDEIDYSLTYDNSTNLTVFTYADTTGAVQTGCLKVLKMEGTGNTEVYYSCIESTSGVLSYEINDTGTYVIRAIFRLTSEYDSIERVVDEIIRQGTPERFVIIGKFGSVISLLLTGTAAALGIAASSIPLGLGLIVASLILENLMGWINITTAVLYSLISIGILIAINLKRK